MHSDVDQDEERSASSRRSFSGEFATGTAE